MKKNFARRGCIFLIFCLLWSGVAALGAEQETVQYYEGMFPPPQDGQVSLLADSTAIKTAIRAALEARDAEVSLRDYGLSAEQAYNYFYEVVYENPELFYVKTAIAAGVNGSGTVIRLIFSESYAYTDAATIEQNKKQIDAEVEMILSSVDAAMTNAEKALAVHDRFVLRYAYDLQAYESQELTAAHRIDGLFIDKTAVCQGYALGYNYVLSKLGIETEYVISRAMGHAWSMVKSDDSWYHVDVTYDDPLFGEEDRFGYVSHENFLRSDMGIMETDHYDWESIRTADAEHSNMFWEDITSGIFYADGKWYYKEETRIVSRRFTDSAATAVYTVTAAWPGNGYADFFGIDIYNGRIYYNTATEIRSISLSGEKETVHFLPDTDGKSIYSLAVFGDTLCYAIGDSYASTHTVVSEALPFGVFVQKKEGVYSISFPDEAPSAGFCMATAYSKGEMTGLKIVPFSAGDITLTIPALYFKEAFGLHFWDRNLRPLFEEMQVG